jgi:hypothetical protein
MVNGKKWTISIIQESEDFILPLPDELLQSLEWKEGDLLSWIEHSDGSWILTKIKSHE